MASSSGLAHNDQCRPVVDLVGRCRGGTSPRLRQAAGAGYLIGIMLADRTFGNFMVETGVLPKTPMKQRIIGFDTDDVGHWRAKLVCRHYQHVRHDPPLVKREWVTSASGRKSRLGEVLECKKCDDGSPADF